MSVLDVLPIYSYNFKRNYIFLPKCLVKRHMKFSPSWSSLLGFYHQMIALKIWGSFIGIGNARKSEGHAHEGRAAKGDQWLRGPSRSCRKGGMLFWNFPFQALATQNAGCGSAASGSPGSWLETQKTSGPLGPAESESALNKVPQGVVHTGKFEKHLFRQVLKNPDAQTSFSTSIKSDFLRVKSGFGYFLKAPEWLFRAGGVEKPTEEERWTGYGAVTRHQSVEEGEVGASMERVRKARHPGAFHGRNVRLNRGRWG